MNNDKRYIYIMVFIAIIAAISLGLAYYLTYRDTFLFSRNINDGDKGMIIGFQ